MPHSPPTIPPCEAAHMDLCIGRKTLIEVDAVRGQAAHSRGSQNCGWNREQNPPAVKCDCQHSDDHRQDGPIEKKVHSSSHPPHHCVAPRSRECVCGEAVDKDGNTMFR